MRQRVQDRLAQMRSMRVMGIRATVDFLDDESGASDAEDCELVWIGHFAQGEDMIPRKFFAAPLVWK